MLKPLARLLAATSAFLMLSAGGAGAMEIASVNDEAITLQELNYAVQTLPEYRKLQQEVLKRVIINTLYYQESVKAGTKVDESLVDSNYEKLKSKFTADKVDFDQLLRSQGKTAADIKNGIRKQLMVQAFIADIDKKAGIEITDEEAKLFYDEQPSLFSTPEKVRVSHIHIALPADATDDEIKKGLEKIQAVEKELDAGKPFAEVAKARSNAVDAKNGGDVGFITKDSPVAKSLLDASFSLKKGERSGIIKSLDGYHIIEVTDRKSPSTMGFDEVKDSIKNNMTKERLQIQRAYFEKSMADKADIKIHLK
ncbi:peptidylprolyl isomerase [Desulfoluna spongiiphila]|uniref:peptidylprolyl isomerase n=1 Tax=Desulfoluna spongiiphila TaxID=419481 RepID=A0A1G5FMF7_9BACT|nr:peptidyl-prolyl cis-trans isomerase [Desulfoluna spongiiphila]SCY40475.1 peptidyl-prolyl cis-trans isomerase C [Desulfoluna spongiiphila]VVS95515.1 peptidyl-prolyl cis-trans isomerase ppic-type [Desulfoluna spongiiphila]